MRPPPRTCVAAIGLAWNGSRPKGTGRRPPLRSVRRRGDSEQYEHRTSEQPTRQGAAADRSARRGHAVGVGTDRMLGSRCPPAALVRSTHRRKHRIGRCGLRGVGRADVHGPSDARVSAVDRSRLRSRAWLQVVFTEAQRRSQLFTTSASPAVDRPAIDGGGRRAGSRANTQFGQFELPRPRLGGKRRNHESQRSTKDRRLDPSR